MKISKEHLTKIIREAIEDVDGTDPSVYAKDSLYRVIEELSAKLKRMPPKDIQETTQYIQQNDPELYEKADSLLRIIVRYFN